MSSYLLQDITCPCGEVFEKDLWSAVNVQQDPALKDELLAGRLNVVPCPICRRLVYAERFVLYHDPPSELLAFTYPANHQKEKDRWAAKTQEDFKAAQEALPQDQRLSYPAIALFGFDQLVFLITREEEENDQGQIVEAMAASLQLEIKKLSPSTARARGVPAVLPLFNNSLRLGLERLLKANDRLTVYAALQSKWGDDGLAA